MKISTREIKKAAALLQSGGLVAFPTETVYGLGGNALSDDAVARIYEVKERPRFNPLIVHVGSLGEAEAHASFGDDAYALASRFWPGPLTLVLPRKIDCQWSLLVSAGLDSVAVREPAHPLARLLLQEAGLPIAAPSANRSGRISPTEASHVRDELGDRVGMVLDGGACHVGIESTVVDLTGETPIILRHGAVTAAMLREIVPLAQNTGQEKIKSPGMLERHYAPSHPLRLDAISVNPGEALLAFGSYIPPGAISTENISQSSNLREAAANLFSMLRRLDKGDITGIAVMPIPPEGLGEAINDRLKRAAAPKD